MKIAEARSAVRLPFREPMVMIAIMLALIHGAGSASAQTIREPAPPFIAPADVMEMIRSGDRRGVDAVRAAYTEHRYDELGISNGGARQRYTDEQRRQLLDGLETIAIDEASSYRGSPGREALLLFRSLSFNPVYTVADLDIGDRMLRIYRDAATASMKGAALDLLADFIAQSDGDCPEALELLASIASNPPVPGDVSPMTALRALFDTCEKGAATVRRLYEEQRGVTGEVRMELRSRAMAGFPNLRGTLGPSCGQTWREYVEGTSGTDTQRAP